MTGTERPEGEEETEDRTESPGNAKNRRKNFDFCFFDIKNLFGKKM